MQSLVGSAIRAATRETDRSAQSAASVLGVSDIGVCREQARRMILGEQPTQDVYRYDGASFVGTAVGDHAEAAVLTWDSDGGWVKQASVTVKIAAHGFMLNLPGHPDLYRRGDLVEFKSKDGLGVWAKSGPDLQQRFQTTLYAKALVDDGLMDADAMLHLVYVDRSGRDPDPVVHSRPYSPFEVLEIEEWLDDVLYAVIHDEEASRDKPREWCFAACEFAPACRGTDTDVQGLLEDPLVLDAVRVYTEAQAVITAATKDKKSAESVLRDISGSTGEYTIRWIEVGPTVVPEQTRAGYRRLDLRPIRARKTPTRKRVEDEHG